MYYRTSYDSPVGPLMLANYDTFPSLDLLLQALGGAVK